MPRMKIQLMALCVSLAAVASPASAAPPAADARSALAKGHDLAAARDVGKALQQSLSAAKNAAAKDGVGEMTIHPHLGALAINHQGTGGSTSSGSTNPSGSQSGSSGQGGSSTRSYLEQARDDLSAARVAVRNSNQKQATQDLQAAMQQLEAAMHSHHHHHASGQTGSNKSASTQTVAKTSGQTNSTNSTNASSNGNASQQQNSSHLQNAVKYVHGAIKQVKEGQDGKAELDIHDAFVQLNHAIQQHEAK